MRTSLLLLTLALPACLATSALATDEARARNLINSLGCKGCHSFEGSGGSFGPALDSVGKRLTKEQLQAKLLTPKAMNQDSMMPSYDHLSKEDIAILVDFLAARK